jgi:hypothetical protein
VAFLLEQGAHDAGEEGGVRLLELWGLTEAVFAAGSVLAGVHEAPSRGAALALAARLRARIAEERP